jgi:hypothetical protein
MWVFDRQLRRRLRRGAVAAGTLLAVVVCAVGVPLPTTVHKPHAERFPCEDHPCGCVDADACWRHCCCFSDSEKLAWAQREGIAAPTFVVATARREAATASVRGAGCCSQGQSTCDHREDEGLAADAPGSHHHGNPAPRPGMRIVLLHAAMKCRGITVSTCLLPPSLPAPCVVSYPHVAVHFAPLCGESLQYESPYLAVATPPPDAAQA